MRGRAKTLAVILRHAGIVFAGMGMLSNAAMMSTSGRVLSEKLEAVRLTFYTAPISALTLLPFFLWREVSLSCPPATAPVPVSWAMSSRMCAASRAGPYLLTRAQKDICTVGADMTRPASVGREAKVPPLVFCVRVQARYFRDFMLTDYRTGLAVLLVTSCNALAYNIIHNSMIKVLLLL